MDQLERLEMAWRALLDKLDELEARTDVQTIVIGNLLPAFGADTATTARVQAALEVATEAISPRTATYRENWAAETNRYLGALQAGISSRK